MITLLVEMVTIFHGYDGDDVFAIGNSGDNYADGGAGYDKIRGNGFEVPVENLIYATTNVPAGTAASEIHFFGRSGELGAKIYFDANGSLIHERQLGTDDPQYNVYDNIEELHWKYHHGERRDEDDVFGEIIVTVDNANRKLATKMRRAVRQW